MNVLYGILLVNLLLIPISVHGCSSSSSDKSIIIEGDNHWNISFQSRPTLPFQYLVGLVKWSDAQMEIYCTGAIVRVYKVYIVVLANHECLKHFVRYEDIKLVKWNTAKKTTFGKEYIDYNPSGNTKSTVLTFVQYTNWEVEVVIITLTESEDPYEINNSTPAIPYDNSTSSNTVKIYTSSL
ncbi:hypothetical protein QE152_g36649 [Popillia japonica]|uniref:Uncharacterized protein n=1 Tax=Popillia japonica TaxID=7064 RepID=A0AAW1ID40_POPJA